MDFSYLFYLIVLIFFLQISSSSPVTVATVPVNNLQQPKLLISLETGDGVVSINVEEAKELLSSGHLYLDVRTIEEFDKGHVDNAINVPYMFSTPEGRVKNSGFVEQVSFEFKKEDHIVVGCQSGVRSLYAAEGICGGSDSSMRTYIYSLHLLQGYKNVKNMGGGYLAWVQNGITVTKPKDELK
ncbi:thiosulfate sulfurtransferase 18-like [Dioscorea cayenensis subsp. rotundata]|uniref:Thiosulfate sulfurtransferase 18-like n=1 Tax=Dioscorea cayennensis subsp. rotundata TaxID=55577 RepID=A0AB40D371_DIOCR|nr:thiosulfate sulfurtransferase 18-like [Dioscorea cayenensis subsp. rotundata]